MLTASGLMKAYGTRVLFRDVTLKLAPGRRVALVGGNGTGKTTLLELLVGQGEADAGEVHRPRDLRIGYLPQEGPAGAADRPVDGEPAAHSPSAPHHRPGPGPTVLEEALAGAEEVAALAERLHRLEQAVAQPDGADVLGEYGEVRSRFEQLGGYALEAQAHKVLAGLGFDAADAGRPVTELSGGWRMRVGLARLLVGEPDLLVLDEPTNHLDVDSVAWLEQHLAAFPGALLFVSHDRDFIDAVANRVIELAGGVATEYVGGFAEFVAAREERLEQQRAAAAQQGRQVARTERFIERFRYKATKARQVQSRVKALEKLDRIEVPDDQELRARFQFPKPPRSPRVVAELEGVTAGYDGEVVLEGVDLAVERGMRVALVGPNGAGKTTLLRLLLGRLEPMKGEARVGANVIVASFSQHSAEELDPGRTVYQEFTAAVPEVEGRNARTLLGSFGFPGDMSDRLVGDLSGGERTRLALGKLMVEPANLLVLDEPTNHLDLPSCDLLEDALRAYPATVLLVTHDRYLIRSVATDVVEVRSGTARFHHGVEERVLAPQGVPPSVAPTRRPSAPSPAAKGGGRAAGRPSEQRAAEKRVEADHRNRRFRETKDLKARIRAAERRWEKAEAEVARLQQELAAPDVYEDREAVAELVARHDRAKDDAAAAMAEWEQASTALERIEAALTDR